MFVTARESTLSAVQGRIERHVSVSANSMGLGIADVSGLLLGEGDLIARSDYFEQGSRETGADGATDGDIILDPNHVAVFV